MRDVPGKTVDLPPTFDYVNMFQRGGTIMTIQDAKGYKIRNSKDAKSRPIQLSVVLSDMRLAGGNIYLEPEGGAPFYATVKMADNMIAIQAITPKDDIGASPNKEIEKITVYNAASDFSQNDLACAIS